MKRNIFFIVTLITISLIFGCKEKSNSGLKTVKSKTEISEFETLQKELYDMSIEDANKKGLEFYKKGEYEKAAFCFRNVSGFKLYEEDENDSAFYAPGFFNYACVRAIQYGQKKYNNYDEIITFLSWAIDLDEKWLKKAKKDKDLDSIRNTEKFKQLIIRSDLKYALINDKSNENFEYIKTNIDKLKDIQARDNFGNGLFFYAVKGQDFKVVDLLLEHGVDINKGFAGGNSTLLYLYMLDSNHHYNIYCFDMIKYLIDKGADINVELNTDYEFDQFEEFYNKLKSPIDPDGLLSYSGGTNLLSIALGDGQYNKRSWEVVKILFDHNIDLDLKSTSPDDDGELLSAFHLVPRPNNMENKNDIEFRAYVSSLLKKHKDQEKAKKIIKYINGEIDKI